MTAMTAQPILATPPPGFALIPIFLGAASGCVEMVIRTPQKVAMTETLFPVMVVQALVKRNLRVQVMRNVRIQIIVRQISAAPLDFVRIHPRENAAPQVRRSVLQVRAVTAIVNASLFAQTLIATIKMFAPLTSALMASVKIQTILFLAMTDTAVRVLMFVVTAFAKELLSVNVALLAKPNVHPIGRTV